MLPRKDENLKRNMQLKKGGMAQTLMPCLLANLDCAATRLL